MIGGRKYIRCNVCRGKGIVPTPDRSKWQICPRCHGEGVIPVPVENAWRMQVEPARY